MQFPSSTGRTPDSTHTRRLLLALLIYFFGVMLIAAAIFVISRAQYLAEIDARLFAAAENMPRILPVDFHDRAIGPEAISPSEDQINLDELSRHAATGGFAYLYTYVQQGEVLYFTSSNYTAEDVRNDTVSRYWTSYPEGKPAFFAALHSEIPLFDTYSDRWGTFRSALLRFHSPKGHVYVAGADIDISVIERSLWLRVLGVMGIGIVMLGLALPLVLVFRRTYAAMNEELLQLNVQLNQDIEHARKVEDELRRATEAANVANACKSQFLANMSHEIRTPLNGIIGVNELMRLTAMSEQQREYTEVTRRSSEVLLETINQILDFASIESGELHLRPESVSVQDLADEVAQMFASLMAQQPVDMVLRVDLSVPARIHADRMRLRQVLINLIGNALKFTSQGGVEVCLRWRDGLLFGHVEDTGIGIPQESQQRIFEPFQQVDNSASRKYSGTGLGLSLSRTLCRNMGGDLWLERSTSLGSLFAFRIAASALADSPATQTPAFQGKLLVQTAFPPNGEWIATCARRWHLECHVLRENDSLQKLLTAQDVLIIDANTGLDNLHYWQAHVPAGARLIWLDWHGVHAQKQLSAGVLVMYKPLTGKALAAALQCDSEPEPQATVASSSHARVLIVEDNAINRLAMLRMLETGGYSADIAENGFEAVSACNSHRYDVVLMDIQMAGMDGIEATRRIVSKLGSQAPVIIGVSAHVFPEHIAEAKAAGMSDYLGKPLRREELLAHVRAVLEDKLVTPA